MQLSAPHRARFEAFLDKIASDTYPEEPSSHHDAITDSVMQHALTILKPAEGARILDVGCGQGVALTRFIAKGFRPTGIALNDVDVSVCRSQGFDVHQMDQSFLDFEDGAFDLVWCRHCLEHSIFPYFTLSGFHRVLAPGGALYIEVPAPDTACSHQLNGNHYAVMGKSMIGSLIVRSGFDVLDTLEIKFPTPMGQDAYWGFVARRRG